jgi:hypothetical protein
LKTAIIISIFFILSGCKIDVTTDLYLNDLRDTAENNLDDLKTTGILKVQIADCGNKDSLREVSNLLDDYFLNLKTKTCNIEGMQSLLKVGVDIPIFSSTKNWESKTKSIFGILVDTSNSASAYTIAFGLDLSRFSVLNQSIENKYFDTLKFGESIIMFAVNNDGKKDMAISVKDSIVDGKPITSKKFIVSRREKIELEPSNVRRLSFSENGLMPILVIPIS